jgi:hypothetical protein
VPECPKSQCKDACTLRHLDYPRNIPIKEGYRLSLPKSYYKSGIVTPGFKEQSRVHLIHAPKKTTYIITECIEINVTIKSEYLLHSGRLNTK